MNALLKGSIGLTMLASSTVLAAAEELSLAHFVAPSHVVTASVVEPLAEGVKADSNGDLTIQVYPGGELGAGPMEQYVRAVQGVADITWGLAGYTSSQFPKSMIVEMPGAVPEGVTGYDMLWNAFDIHLKSEFPGTHPLALWISEPNVFIMKDHDVRSPDDLKGLRIRVSGSVSGALVEALGATPVQMPAGEMYNALQTGLIDGIVTGSSAINDFKLDEVANSYTVGAPLGHIMFYLVMNQGRYDGLSAEHKAILDKHTGRTLSQKGEEGWNAAAERTMESVRADSGNTVIDLTEEEIVPFKEVADRVREKLIADMGAQDVLDAMVAKN
ncbi:TRAP transporter substrate-binding protein [Chelativorans sp. AA-79]|uniref:TRAP transporter substrate-binding protein n=1 Tax=Chelativorans sp. AA-79 TaxID=3028735 RepID=UPI0023F7F6E7|nr:TRAP transporter substrate-binding protein [Chelativorans sp. AA-79]WEX10532.1 TRAP transporter substrate-binding protein [Chelativorans sp. AA-79]